MDAGGGGIGDRRLDLRSRPVWYPIHSWESYSPSQKVKQQNYIVFNCLSSHLIVSVRSEEIEKVIAWR